MILNIKYYQSNPNKKTICVLDNYDDFLVKDCRVHPMQVYKILKELVGEEKADDVIFKSREYKGIATCDDRDSFDSIKGKRIAKLKAMIKSQNDKIKRIDFIIDRLDELMSDLYKCRNRYTKKYNSLYDEYYNDYLSKGGGEQ